MKINYHFAAPELKNTPHKKMQAEYVTIHTTGNPSATATAKAHANLQASGNLNPPRSWHYTVDSNEIWQSYADDEMCWHAGDAKGNSCSIGIEICNNDKANFPAACQNAAWLTAELLKKHDLTLERVVQHYYWSGKDCPHEIRLGTWGVTWNGFLDMVNAYFKLEDAAKSKTRIVNQTTTSVSRMENWARSKNANPLFVQLASRFYNAATAAGIDPAVVYCQSALETGFMNFGGVLDETFCNPCGLKNPSGGGDTDPSAHMRFSSWTDGIRAQVDHLALYAGAVGYPNPNSADPRHFPYLFNTAQYVEDLSGKWAPSPGYGQKIIDLMNSLHSAPEGAPATISPETLTTTPATSPSVPATPPIASSTLAPTPEQLNPESVAVKNLIALVDGEKVFLGKSINHEDTNYVKLRDIAYYFGYEAGYNELEKLPTLIKI